MRPLLPYLKRYRWGFVVGALCILLSNGAQAGLPRVIGNAAQSLESGVTRHKLLIFTLQVLALAVVLALLVSRSLQDQIANFLGAAQRLGNSQHIRR